MPSTSPIPDALKPEEEAREARTMRSSSAVSSRAQVPPSGRSPRLRLVVETQATRVRLGVRSCGARQPRLILRALQLPLPPSPDLQ
jgi:hypothetical protein